MLSNQPARIFFAAATLTLSCVQSAAADEKLCKASNGVAYNPWEIFDEEYACYVGETTDATQCAADSGRCGGLALIKLANYESANFQDLLYAPHRGVWGGLYGSEDPEFIDGPGQNTMDAFELAQSFRGSEYGTNTEGKDYRSFLRGSMIEIDATSYANDTDSENADYVGVGIISHYLTTDNTVEGSLNQYLVDMTEEDLDAFDGYLENRDFSASDQLLNEMSPSSLATQLVVNATGKYPGPIFLIDTKSRRGDIQCVVYDLQKGTDAYDEYECQWNEPANAQAAKDETDKLVAQEIYDTIAASSKKNASIVIKTSTSYADIQSAFCGANATAPCTEIAKHQWQPHPPKNSVNEMAQYIHDWLVNVPKSVAAWELNIYFQTDETNKLFCVSSYDSSAGSYGTITTQYVSSMTDTSGCVYGPYENLLDYIRVNTGNPDYFGFSQDQKDAVLISSNRANLWLLSTAAPNGTSDRYYRWQTLGSDPTYNMSDPVRYLTYPYVAYQIITGDRMEAVRQVMSLGLYQKYGGPTDQQ